MRVIFLTHNYPRFSGDLPGAFLHPLALALQARGVDVRVVAPADRGQGGDGMLDGVPIRRVRYASAHTETLAYTGRMMAATRSMGGWRSLAGLWQALRRSARQLASNENGPVVIHAHWWFPSGSAAPPELPAVVTLHGTDAQLLLRGGPVAWLGRRVLKRARVVTTVSRYLAEVVRRQTGVVAAPDAVQGMPVDPGRLAISQGGGGVVSVARLTSQKRLLLLVEAAHILRAQGRPMPVTIVGEGEARPELEAAITRFEVRDLVRLTGLASPEEVAGHLRHADLFVLPAQAEGYGLAAAEALFCGVPCVVCRDGGGLLDLVPPQGSGRVVDPDAQALAAAITQLRDDAGARTAAQERGATLKEHLHPDHVAEQALGWYRRALAPP